MIGPQFSWVDGYSAGRTHLSILPIFELPETRTLQYGNEPMIVSWINGVHIDYKMDNRLDIFFELITNYDRTGRVLYQYDADATCCGTLVHFGVLRNFDFYGNSTKSFKYENIKGKVKNQNKSILYVFSPTISWFDPKNDTTYFVSRYQVGFSLIGYEKEFNLVDEIAFVVGGFANLFVGGTFRPIEGKSVLIGDTSLTCCSDIKISNHSLSIPMGVRFYVFPNIGEAVWLYAGLDNEFLLIKNYSLKPEDSEKVELETDIFKPNNFVQSIKISTGMDFIVGRYTIMRVGLTFKKGLKEYFSGTVGVYKSNSISITTGLMFK